MKKLRKRRLFLSVIVLIVILLLSATVFKKENLKEASLNEETIMTNIVAEKRQYFTSTGEIDFFRAFLFFQTLMSLMHPRITDEKK